MEATLLDWLQLTVRWLHFVLGAAWIGTSFYFNWLNHNLRAPDEARPGVGGELWAVHGGGFYQVTKYTVAPARLPTTLHWFKWEAYLTWVTGMCLLALVYYLHADVYLIDILEGHCGSNPRPTYRDFTGEERGVWTGLGRLR